MYDTPSLYDPIKWLRDKHVEVRLGLPQGGVRQLEVRFTSSRYRSAREVQRIYQRIEQSRGLIMMQLNVEKGLPPRSVESLIAKGYLAVERRNGKGRYVITGLGRRWMG